MNKKDTAVIVQWITDLSRRRFRQEQGFIYISCDLFSWEKWGMLSWRSTDRPEATSIRFDQGDDPGEAVTAAMAAGWGGLA